MHRMGGLYVNGFPIMLVKPFTLFLLSSSNYFNA